jgi:hypothetical protein
MLYDMFSPLANLFPKIFQLRPQDISVGVFAPAPRAASTIGV